MSIANWLSNAPEELTTMIVDQRWFGDKSRTRTRVSPALIHEFAHDGQQFGLVQAEFEFEEGDPSTYFVPILHRSDDTFVDALYDPSFLSWIAEGFVDGRSLKSDGGRIAWRTAGKTPETSWTSRPSRVLEGEQSNTSVIYGSDAIVKVFRKLQAGVNPDTEIVAFLAERHAFPHVPAFLGSIVLELDGDREPVELVAVQGFVPNQGDCWRWLPGALRAASDSERTELLDSVRLLGQRTGELHVALSDADGEPDFEAEPFSGADIKALEERLGREARLTASMLHRQGACSHAESEALASSLLASVSQADVLAGSLQSRVHGDYHLGQVLRADGDFVIIDFEGEPSRPMRERRQKSSPLKDVAGMLRSIDYAVATAKDGEDDRTLETWREQAEAAFLDGYLGVVGKEPRALVPSSSEAFRRALDLFMIEKALYEVRYELDNRPDWVEIPFGALRRIGAGD